MLAIISDLHFCDGTATEKNVTPGAFALALGDIYGLASDLAKRRNRPTDLDLVLLGDIIDLLRTERWFEEKGGAPVPLSERPWGSARGLEGRVAEPAVIARAGAILDEILTENVDALRTLRGELNPPPDSVRVRRIYMPGNHDRLYLHDAALARRIRAALGAVDSSPLGGEGIFETHLAMPEYGLLARHGHEWDPWNFGGWKRGATAGSYTRDDHLATPIGDAITTELAARLPYEIRRRLSASSAIRPEVQEDVYRRMQRIEDVRPLLASFHWAYYEADHISGALGFAQAKEVRSVVDAAVKEIVHQFRQLDFYRAWMAKNNRPLKADPADMLAAALAGLSHMNVDRVMTIAGLFEAVVAIAEPHDTCRKGAGREALDRLSSQGLRCVVYGHTHEPVEAALHASGSVSDVYLNSGTFRQGVFRTDDKKGFIGWERMTYVSFYSREEAESGAARAGPSFESWTGARRR